MCLQIVGRSFIRSFSVIPNQRIIKKRLKLVRNFGVGNLNANGFEEETHTTKNTPKGLFLMEKLVYRIEHNNRFGVVWLEKVCYIQIKRFFSINRRSCELSERINQTFATTFVYNMCIPESSQVENGDNRLFTKIFVLRITDPSHKAKGG